MLSPVRIPYCPRRHMRILGTAPAPYTEVCIRCGMGGLHQISALTLFFSHRRDGTVIGCVQSMVKSINASTLEGLVLRTRLLATLRAMAEVKAMPSGTRNGALVKAVQTALRELQPRLDTVAGDGGGGRDGGDEEMKEALSRLD